MPECGNRECGPDSLCGVSCGECTQGEICNRYGKCKNPVTEDMGSMNGGSMNGGSMNGGSMNGGNDVSGGDGGNFDGENPNTVITKKAIR